MLECSIHWVSLCYQCHHKKWSYQAQENAKISQRNCDTSWNSSISKNNRLTYFKAVISACDSRSVSWIDWSQSSLSIKSYRDIAEDDRSVTCCNVRRLVSRSFCNQFWNQFCNRFCDSNTDYLTDINLCVIHAKCVIIQAKNMRLIFRLTSEKFTFEACSNYMTK